METISGHYTIKQIFKDHWDDFVKNHGAGIPGYVTKNVEKMLECREPNALGYHRYLCPNHPDEITTIPHSCKSRFCNSCGVSRTKDWIERCYQDFPDSPYYHITFTVSDKLRSYFLLLPDLRNVLFTSSADVIMEWFREHGVLPAVISVLHTFGRDLKFHPHIHMVVTAGGMSLKTRNQWIKQEFIPYDMLRQRWQTKLLISLKAIVPHDVLEELFSMEWYVNVGLKLENARSTVGYVGRYARKPVLAETRMVGYDGMMVTFLYLDFNSGTNVKWTLLAETFVSLLIQHIPPRRFRMIRYYGLIANKGKKKWRELLDGIVFRARRTIRIIGWRMKRILSGGRDPLLCRLCGAEKILVEWAFRNTAGEMIIIPA